MLDSHKGVSGLVHWRNSVSYDLSALRERIVALEIVVKNMCSVADKDEDNPVCLYGCELYSSCYSKEDTNGPKANAWSV